MSGDSRSAVRVGLLVMGALTLAGVAVFLLGEKQNLFRAKNHYYVRLASANGLQVGAAVQLNGVNVGQVVKITLPEDMGETQLQVRLAIDARYEQRIRADSQARIKTLGLLGDKFVEVTSGSPSAPAIAEEGEIPSAPTTNLEQIVSSGEDLMVNVLAISSQLAAILSRMERGEGLLGELTKDVEPGKKMTTELYATLGALRKAAEKIEGGKGPVPRLLGDEALGAKLASSVDRLDSILAKAESGDGVVAALLSDPAQKQKLERAFDSFERAAATVSKLADRLDESEALLPKLLAAGDALILNVGSIAGFEVYPGGAGYTASKHALRALTRTLRLELLGQPVRVTDISPGLAETEFARVRFAGDDERARKVYEGMTPLVAEDVAQAIAWVATRPPHVDIDELVIRPRDQASALLVHRRAAPAGRS